MTRRQFLSGCVVLVAAWVAGLRKVDLRALLVKAFEPRVPDYPMWSSTVSADGERFSMDKFRQCIEAVYRNGYTPDWRGVALA